METALFTAEGIMSLTDIAYCGVDCSACTDKLSGKCPGCRQTEWPEGDECMPIACCKKRGIVCCGECADFPCADMEEFYAESDGHRLAYARMNLLHCRGNETILRIAFLQLKPGESLSSQLEAGMEACRRAKELGADIALFPEMWSNGYCIPQVQEELEAASLEPNSMFIKAFGGLARELEMAIGITYLEAYGAFSRNSLALFDMYGRRVLDYAKVHTCDFSDERILARGNDFYVCELETAKGPVKVGAMICYDREFPESARLLMLKGAELILVPNACPMEINRLSQLRGRAYENMLAIATCNYPEGCPDCNGRSTLFDGAAYLPDGDGSRDTCVFEAPGEPGVYVCGLDIDLLRTYRKTEVHGNAYRRPELYGPLVNERVEEPFLRSDRRR